MREVTTELVGEASLKPPRVPVEAKPTPPAQAPSQAAPRVAPERAETPARRSSRPPRRRDPRRDDTGGARAPDPEPEQVSRSRVVRSSLPPAPADGAEPGSIVIDLSPDAHALIDELCSAGPDDDQPQLGPLLRLGDVALEALEARFPGPLWFSKNQLHARFPAGRDVSPLARALIACDERGAELLQRLLRSSDVEVRLCATLLAADWVHGSLLSPFAERLFDADGQIRRIASTALPVYRNVKGFADVLEALRRRAGNPQEAVSSRLSALEAISVLRDPGSVELLMELQYARERQISLPAHRALIAITGQDFGNSKRRWASWYDKNRDRHRVEWLIDGLTIADERVRAVAGGELQKLTQVYYGYAASASKRARERAQSRYREWWESEGQSLFASGRR